MKLLISLDEFKNYKSRELVPLECQMCRNTFHREKHYVMRGLKKDTHVLFCSLKCLWKSYEGKPHPTIKSKKSNYITFNCGQCNKLVENKYFCPKDLKINASKKHFCSQSCRAVYFNINKTKGCRRSKLEVWIENQLASLYPNLEIHYNKSNAIGAELDVYVPSLNLAFELNGIFHYEEIYKGRLEKTQSNDKKKFRLCQEKNISLCVIDTTSLKYLKEEKAKKFLDIITEIINAKKSRQELESSP